MCVGWGYKMRKAERGGEGGRERGAGLVLDLPEVCN